MAEKLPFKQVLNVVVIVSIVVVVVVVVVAFVCSGVPRH